MKKFVSMFLAAITLASFAVFGTGCGGSETVVNDDKTINVRLYKAGFGDAFIYELKQKFENLYSSEGYNINVLPPSQGSAGTPMVQEMYSGYKDTQIDLYITGGIQPNMVSGDKNVAQYYEKGELCEDLEEIVFNQKAIGYDGKESKDKIADKIVPDFVPFLRADNGKLYAFAWAQTNAGMVVNTKKLKSYGVTELPRTTNELIKVFDLILDSEKAKNTKTYPVTYNLTIGAGGASTYQDCAIQTWLAQYDVDAYNEFLRMQTKGENGWTDMQDGYKIFENEHIKDVLEVGYQFMDKKYSVPGSNEHELAQAQSLVMEEQGYNNAVFMLNGDWFLNEVKKNYSAGLNDIEFMNVPVISSLGVELFGAGTSYALTDEKCDELLSFICKEADANKTIDEIIESVSNEMGITVAAADVEKVADARGVCYSRGIEHVAFITKGSTKKDIAALALRMMASDDFAKTFIDTANASSPYTKSVDATSKYAFINEAKALVDNAYFRAINGRYEGLRIKVLSSYSMFPTISNLALTLYNKADAKSYAAAAEETFNLSITEAKKAWDNYLK